MQPGPTAFEMKMAGRAAKSLRRVEDAERELTEARAALRVAQDNCPHLRIQENERTSAECNSWTECLDCGAEVKAEGAAS